MRVFPDLHQSDMAGVGSKDCMVCPDRVLRMRSVVVCDVSRLRQSCLILLRKEKVLSTSAVCTGRTSMIFTTASTLGIDESVPQLDVWSSTLLHYS